METYGLAIGDNSSADNSNARSFLSGANTLPGRRSPPFRTLCFQAQEVELKTEIILPLLLRDIYPQ